MKHYLPFILAGLFAFMGIQPVSAFQMQQKKHPGVSENELIDAQTSYIKGLEEFANENYQQALDLLTAAYVKLEDHAGVNFALSDVYLQIDDLSNAAYYGKQATKLEPDNKWYHVKLAEIYRNAGKNQATIKELELALKYHPDATDVLFELAQTYASHGELLKSNKIYNQLLKHSGPDINIYLQKLKNFDHLDMRDSSIVELKRIRELDPDNLSTLQILGNYYIEMDKPQEAKEVLKSGLEKNGRDPKTLIMLADIFAEEAKWDRVGTLLGDVVSDPLIVPEAKLTVTQYMFSRYRREPSNKQLYEATTSIIDQFVKQEPEFAQAHVMAADFYAGVQQNDKALQALAKANELMPGNELAWRQRLQLLLSERRYAEAIEAGLKAEKQVPQDPFILYFLGSAYLAGGQHKPAADKLQEAVDLPARNQLKSAIYTSLGDAHAGTKKWESAFEAYEQALKLNPKNDLVLNNYAYYLSLQGQQLDKAEQMALKAVELAPDNASYLDTAGWVYYQKGNYEKARRYIQASVDTGQASADVLEHMGDVLDKLNEPQNARSWWQKALDKDPSRKYLKEKLLQ